MKLGFVVVLFNPSRDQVENFEFLCKIWDTVLIDNSGEPLLCPPMNYLHVGFGKNLARAKNKGFEYLREKKCSHVCYLDQDASLTELDKFFFKSLNMPKFVSAPKKLISRIKFGRPNVIPIANGCIYSLNAHADLGGFDEALLIDCVDEDYILKGLKRGYSVDFNEGSYLEHSHEIGTLNRVQALGRTFYFSIHPGWRVRLMFRNRIILSWRYKAVMSRYVYICARDILGFFFQKQDAIKLLGAASLGIISGLRFCVVRAIKK